MVTLSAEPNRVLTLTGLAAALTRPDIYAMLGLEASIDILEAVRIARNRRIIREIEAELARTPPSGDTSPSQPSARLTP